MDGFIVINKPLGYTSRDVVNVVGKCLMTKKAGHTGTLDPKASGVMVVAVGKALKFCELMMEHDKEYLADVIVGIETDTGDMDSNATIIREVDNNLNEVVVKQALESFKGMYMQTVPKYSAVKVNGRKLYEYARSQTPVTLPKREVIVKDIELIGGVSNKDDKTHFKFKSTVSKGTYIRSLVNDIGKMLGYPAVMDSLVRTRQGNFSIDDSYTLEDIENGNYKLISITEAFPNIRIINVDDVVAFKVRNGVILDHFFDDDMAFIADSNNTLLALYQNIDNKSRPYKMFV